MIEGVYSYNGSEGYLNHFTDKISFIKGENQIDKYI